MQKLKDICIPLQSDPRVIGEFKNNVELQIEAKFKPHIIYKVAMFLYPPTKHLSFLSEDEKREVFLYIKNAVNNHLSEIPSNSNAESGTLSAVPLILQKFVNIPQIQRHNSSTTIDMETNTYLSEALDENFDILKYWKTKKFALPKLYEVVKKVIVVPSTSAPSERAFSLSGFVYSPHRTNLSYEVLNELLVLKSDGKIRNT